MCAVVAGLLLVGCGTETAEPEPPAVTPSSAAPTTATGSPCLSTNGNSAEPDSVPNADKYVGLTLREAKELARPDVTIRVAGRDGSCFPLTMDYRTDRVNVYLENGTVTQATIG